MGTMPCGAMSRVERNKNKINTTGSSRDKFEVLNVRRGKTVCFDQ